MKKNIFYFCISVFLIFTRVTVACPTCIGHSTPDGMPFFAQNHKAHPKQEAEKVADTDTKEHEHITEVES